MVSSLQERRSAFFERLLRKATAERLPLAGSIELTSRCNLRCVHCYLGESDRQTVSGDMPASRIIKLLDEMADAGCLYLLITGGEPLLRPDFERIYTYAKEKGFIITLFTNATLLTQRHIELFRDLPPKTIEISIYGSTAETYEKITGIRGSFEKCMKSISGLLAEDLDVRLKTVLMNLNSHELAAMESLAANCGVKFRFDAALFPKFDGDAGPLGLRVPAHVAVAAELSDSSRFSDWSRFSDKFSEHVPSAEILYHCGAGKTSFHVDADGNLRPCLMTRSMAFDISAGGFHEAWESLTALMQEKKTRHMTPCSGCGKMHLCGYCPAFFELENGAEETSSDYLCAMGTLRHELLKTKRTERETA